MDKPVLAVSLILIASLMIVFFLICDIHAFPSSAPTAKVVREYSVGRTFISEFIPQGAPDYICISSYYGLSCVKREEKKADEQPFQKYPDAPDTH